MILVRQFALLLLVVAAAGQAQVVVDRMAAVVNKQVIMESELDQEMRLEALLEGQPPAGARLGTPEALHVLDQMVDRALLEQTIRQSDVPSPSPDEVAQRLKDIRARIPGADTESGWKARLAADDLTQRDVENHVMAEFRVLHYIDLRFRGLVRVDKTEIAAYYQEKFLPQLRRQGAPEPPLADVSDKIEKVLVEQRLDEMLNEWLQTLRLQAHIEKMLAAPSVPPRGANP